mmetsp:Transcript_64649/g.162707  ORF Transcript_64649/g.162707 Transcript_64649/m.162707 type:complete len:209 (-) Transcript_64649:35-661(-)
MQVFSLHLRGRQAAGLEGVEGHGHEQGVARGHGAARGAGGHAEDVGRPPHQQERDHPREGDQHSKPRQVPAQARAEVEPENEEVVASVGAHGPDDLAALQRGLLLGRLRLLPCGGRSGRRAAEQRQAARGGRDVDQEAEERELDEGREAAQGGPHVGPHRLRHAAAPALRLLVLLLLLVVACLALGAVLREVRDLPHYDAIPRRLHDS